MLVIGITGGVGSGKSHVLKYLQEHCNCKIVLADDVANKVKEPGQQCYKQVIDFLGKDILNEDKTINKNKMAERIFSNDAVLEKINQMIHPAVKEYILNEIAYERQNNKTDVFFLEAALLIEAGYLQYLDELWYIYCSKNARIERLKKFRQYSEQKINQIMNSQLSEEEYKKFSDVVLDNSYDFELTMKSIKTECIRLKIWKE